MPKAPWSASAVEARPISSLLFYRSVASAEVVEIPVSAGV
jgi:hypothetical protein